MKTDPKYDILIEISPNEVKSDEKSHAGIRYTSGSDQDVSACQYTQGTRKPADRCLRHGSAQTDA